MYDLNLRTSNRGIYLSHQMVDALLIVNSNGEELVEFVSNCPNLANVSQEEVNQINTMAQSDLESARKHVFEMYQQSYIHYMNMADIKDEFRFLFHLKVEGLKLPMEDEERLYEILVTKGEKECYQELASVYHVDDKRIRDIRLSSLDDYENIKSATFEQIVAYNEQIKSDINMSKMRGGDYTLVVGSSRFLNTMFVSPDSNLSRGYQYDSYFVEQGYRLTEMLGANSRFHCIIDRNTAKALFEEKKYTSANKAEVLDLLREFTTQSLEQVRGLNQNGSRITVVELFNELVECNKDDKTKPYQEVWQQYFGISIDDIIEHCILPNREVIQELKNNGVRFMYNETLLQESSNKRQKVEEVYDYIQQKCPGLIDVFGDQMHYTDGDLAHENIEQLREEAKFLQTMQQKILVNGRPLSVECTEFDFGINKNTSKKALEQLKTGEITESKVVAIKQNMINQIQGIFGGVNFSRHCDWTTLDNIDCRIVREGKSTGERFYNLLGGKFVKISGMKKSDLQQDKEYLAEKEKLNGKKNTFNEQRNRTIGSTTEQKSSGHRFKFSEVRRRERQKSTQTQTINPSSEMTASYEQMKAKKVENTRKMENNKPKVLTRKLPNNINGNNGETGFVSILSLLIIIGLVVGTLCFIVYNLCK